MYNHKPKTVIVLGVARGGTSLTAGILDILGVDMGKGWMSDREAPKGYFEDQDFRDLFEDIFKLALKDVNLGKIVLMDSFYWSKNCPSTKKILKISHRFKQQIKNLIDKKNKNKKIWGWKHPWTHLMIEAFLPYLKNPYFVVVLRNIDDVVKSGNHSWFLKNNNMLKTISPRVIKDRYDNIFNFFNKYKKLPVIFLKFEDIINNPIEQSTQIAKFLELKLSSKKIKKIKKFVIPRNQIIQQKKSAKVKEIIGISKRGLFGIIKNPKKFFYYINLFYKRYLSK